MALIPCPGCQRHVRAEEKVCPFCEARISEAGGSTSAVAGVAAAAVLALAGCGSKAQTPAEPPPSNVGEASPDAGPGDVEPTPPDPDPIDRDGMVQPLYGVDRE
jgi:hypothetical protein